MKNAVRDSAGYCGPTVVAAITGKPTSKVEDVIRDWRRGTGWRREGRTSVPVRGTNPNDLHYAFSKFGWRFVKEEVAKKDPVPAKPKGDALAPLQRELDRMFNPRFVERSDGRGFTRRPPRIKPHTARLPTLAAWLRARKGADRTDAFVIEVSHHWVAVKGKKFVDTMTKGQWVWLRDIPHRRQRVRNVWRVTRLPAGAKA